MVFPAKTGFEKAGMFPESVGGWEVAPRSGED